MIEFTRIAPHKLKPAPLLIIPFWHEKKGAIAASQDLPISLEFATPALATGDFTGKEGELILTYPPERDKHERIALLGLGSKGEITVEKLRRAYGCAIRRAQEKKITRMAVLFPNSSPLDEESLARGVIEGLLLGNYMFARYKTASTETAVRHVDLVGVSNAVDPLLTQLLATFHGVYLARDLVNGCADEITPQYLSHLARNLAGEIPHMKVKVLGRKQLEEEKMGLMLAVARGSEREPQLIILEYKGTQKNKEQTLLIGKGVTYDTGGLNLKPTGSMETMRCDMGGAATVFGIMSAVGKLQLPINIIAIIPATENSIDASSYKPGDVYNSYAQITVEIGNTDAEGRLILADALAYGVKQYKPTRIIDFATLTGAMEITLGDETTGIMSNDDSLVDAFTQAGLFTYERVWRLPLYEEYQDGLKSDIADIKNVGGRAAGSIAAALFLQKFAGTTAWIHFDIAGTAFLSKEKRYYNKGATAIGVRLTMEYLQSLLP